MLTTLPPIILEHIALHLSLIPTAPLTSQSNLAATPPNNLPALLLCDRFLYQTLNIASNPHLYAHIFNATFDGEAMRRRRRFGHVHVAELAGELVRRWCVVKRFRKRAVEGSRADDEDELLRTDLWTAFVMFTENDGRNVATLIHYAHIDTFALTCVRPGGLLHRHAVEVNGGWTLDNEINALLGWIFWFTDYDRVPNESIEQRDEIIEALSPLYVGSFKYSLPHAPISFFYTPSHLSHKRAARRIQTNVAPAYMLRPAQNPSIHPLTSSPIHPPCLVPCSTSEAQTPYMFFLARPLSIPPVILSYVARQELQYLRWPREPSGVPPGSRAPATRAEARLVDWSGPTGEDYLWFLGVRTQRVELGLGNADESSANRSQYEEGTLSKRWDIDWARLLTCFDPFGETRVPRERLHPRMNVYEPGMLDGLWDGKWLMTFPNIFHGLLHSTEQGVPLPPEFRPPHIQTPMTFRLKEHHSYTSNPDYNLPYDDTGPGALRAWIPENIRFVEDGNHLNIYEDTSQSRFIGTYETFNALESYIARRQRAKTRITGTIEPRTPGRSSPGGRGATFHNSMGKRDDRMDVDFESTNYVWDEDDDESLFGHGVWDIIITAETEPSFAQAWGALSFRGRVRPWDGLVVLERMPANGTGRWIFRGYLHGGINLVGRWRETGTQFDAPGWEGAWVMGRRA